MNKIDLKNKLKDYYLNCLKSNDLNLLIGLDAVKSLMGIDLSLSNNTLIEWFMNYSHKSTSYSAEYLKFKEYKNVPEAISVHSLERCLLAKDIKRARENLFYLSRVSDGIQILEFMLEFSLRYCTDVYKYIWHIMRMQKFLGCEFIVESLNKCVVLIMRDEFIDNKKVISNDSNVKWSTYLLLDEIKPNDLFLYYTIYHSKLIRREMINSLILCRLENIDKKKNKNLDKFINIKVDREERPDLDNVFQKSLAILTGVPGGWPLSMFLDENAVPFSGGTYFPPQEMHGRPSFVNVLNQVSDFYEKNSINNFCFKFSFFLM
mgnify:CR=1 FL=1